MKLFNITLSKAAVIAGANRKLYQNLLGNEMSAGDFENLLHILEKVEGHA